MSIYDAFYFVAAGFTAGMLFGRWCWGRRVSDVQLVQLAALIRGHVAPADPEARRRERLAYDTIYDERHPEEWAS